MNIQQQLENIFNGTGVHLNAKAAESFVAFPYFELGYVAHAILEPKEKNAIHHASIILQNDVWLHYLLNHQKINKLQQSDDVAILLNEVTVSPVSNVEEAFITTVDTAIEKDIVTDEVLQVAIVDTNEIDTATNFMEESTQLPEPIVDEKDVDLITLDEHKGSVENELNSDEEQKTTSQESIENVIEPTPVAPETISTQEKILVVQSAAVENEVNEIQGTVIDTEKPSVTSNPIQEPLAFEPYHTVDYFASQGIKLQQIVNPTDKLGLQLRSFTDWLKSMKRIDPKTAEAADNEVVTEHINVVHLAENSLQNAEIVTETMADVLIMQGKKEEAIAVFHKLSLQDTAKSTYFATRIEQLKSN
jgi:hypothetical protein